MTYSVQLHPWCIVRVLPDNQNHIVARFRRYNDVVAYLQVLQNPIKSTKSFTLLITFDLQGVS